MSCFPYCYIILFSLLLLFYCFIRYKEVYWNVNLNQEKSERKYFRSAKKRDGQISELFILKIFLQRVHK